MRRLILLIIIIGQLSCTNKKIAVSADVIQDGNDTIQNIKNLTESINQQTEIIDIDTLTETEFIGLFKKKQRTKYDIHNDRSLANNIEKCYDFWTNKKLLINDTLKRIPIGGYPVSFKEKGNQITWLTTIGEGENHNQIRLFTLDKFYNTIDNVVITSYGGDEGLSSWNLGEFKNDSTYLMKKFMTGYDTDSVEDIINSCLIIHSNGKIERLENCP